MNLEPQTMRASGERTEKPVVRGWIVARRQNDLLALAPIDGQRDDRGFRAQPGRSGRGQGERCLRLSGFGQRERVLEDVPGPQSNGSGRLVGGDHTPSAGAVIDGRIGPPTSTTSEPEKASAWAMASRTS